MKRIMFIFCASVVLSGCVVVSVLWNREDDQRFTAFIQNASEHYIAVDNHALTWLKKGHGAIVRFKKNGVYTVYIRAYEIMSTSERGEVKKGPLVWEKEFPLIVDGVTRDYCGEIADVAVIIMEEHGRIGDERDCFKLYIPTLLIEKGKAE